ncbi:putative photosynthetic complex assembly protein PuhE [Alteriqipengyuania lutimaris]|nr:putative photosynthetic complex assembly protein PuhE [Alteriqipengyuania lutimaris]MBB3033772.1 putative photosynthetic complex assembly protein 2 [Alteriqipengyuania lutimaris]
MTGHVLPVLATIAVWFFATGLIAWAANASRDGFSRSLVLAGVAGVAGLGAVLASLRMTGIDGSYLGFVGALAIWGWHELAFLTGGVTGPRREAAMPHAHGLLRFRQASAAVIHHELALGATAAMLVALSWGQPNPLGAQVFALLFGLRLLAKLNLFAGVPNASTDILPRHLAYMTSYFGPNRFTALLGLSIAGTVTLAAWLGVQAAMASAGGVATGASLLFALAALGALEHLFFALPLRDGALWGWAIAARDRRAHTNAMRGL